MATLIRNVTDDEDIHCLFIDGFHFLKVFGTQFEYIWYTYFTIVYIDKYKIVKRISPSYAQYIIIVCLLFKLN